MAVKAAINGSRSRRFAAAPYLLVSILWLLSATVLGAELGGREPVLKQIALPHSYYYREMYVPQVTSGPGGAAWSPDGRELVVAMQGTLWCYAFDTGVAAQLTSGPGYDHQPDWSPNGRYVAYATYNNDAMEIRLLELQSGATLPVTANRAVNLDPRWSPDGRKLAFVSTEHEVLTPPGLGNIIINCLEKNPGNRYRSTRQLVEDLEKLKRDFREATRTRAFLPEDHRPALLVEEGEKVETEVQQEERRNRFIEVAAERLQHEINCRFSQLPADQRARLAGSWYDASSKTMLRGNFHFIHDWTREHVKFAAQKDYSLEDFLQLLRLCRRIALEEEGWQEDSISHVDDAIGEVFTELRGNIPWEIPEGLDYVTGTSAAERKARQLAAEQEAKERAEREAEETRKAKEAEEAKRKKAAAGLGPARKGSRVQLPIRVHGWTREGAADEVLKTQTVSKDGLSFVCQIPYSKGLKIEVIYPYDNTPGALNMAYKTEVLSCEKVDDGFEVEVKFLASAPA